MPDHDATCRVPITDLVWYYLRGWVTKEEMREGIAITMTAAIGLVAFPLLQPTWVYVK